MHASAPCRPKTSLLPSWWHSLQVLAWYWPPVLFIALVGVAVGLYHSLAEVHGAPCVTCGDYTVPFTLTSFALSLLLVFRTNSSYDRCAHALSLQAAAPVMHVIACKAWALIHGTLLAGGGRPGRCGARCSTSRATWSGRCAASE